jgi:hypothetical protein
MSEDIVLSEVERIKAESRFLRGSLHIGLEDPASGGIAESDAVAEIRQIRLWRQIVSEGRLVDHELCARIAQTIPEARHPLADAERNGDRAEACAGEQENDELESVTEDEGDAVSPPDAV